MKDMLVDVIRALCEFAGASQVRNPPQVELKVFGLSEVHLRHIASHFAVPVAKSVDDGRLVVKAVLENVNGRQLTLTMEHERTATRGDLEDIHRAQLARLEVKRVG